MFCAAVTGFCFLFYFLPYYQAFLNKEFIKVQKFIFTEIFSFSCETLTQFTEIKRILSLRCVFLSFKSILFSYG